MMSQRQTSSWRRLKISDINDDKRGYAMNRCLKYMASLSVYSLVLASPLSARILQGGYTGTPYGSVFHIEAHKTSDRKYPYRIDSSSRPTEYNDVVFEYSDRAQSRRVREYECKIPLDAQKIMNVQNLDPIKPNGGRFHRKGRVLYVLTYRFKDERLQNYCFRGYKYQPQVRFPG